MLTAVIVEDEESGRITLNNYLSTYCKDVRVLGMADSVNSGIELIRKTNPNIVFLDVEMPFGNGFDLLEQLDEINFQVVFVTAFSNYAIKALNLSATYYILKPVDIDELLEAVNKIRTYYENRHQNEIDRTKILLNNLKSVNKLHKKITLPILEGFEVVDISDVIRCEAQDNFTLFHLTNGKKMLICRTLKFYEECLDEFDFVRVHKSHLVNIQYVKKYTKGKGGYITLSDGAQIEISSTRKDDFLDRFI